MADPSPTSVSLRGLRNSLSVRVEETSLRRVAREVGLSPTGLDRFLGGGAPYKASRRKLYDWWEREGQRPVETVGTDLARLALDTLLTQMPPGNRPRTVRRMLRALAELHRRDEVAPPPWLPELRAEYEAPAEGPES